MVAQRAVATSCAQQLLVRCTLSNASVLPVYPPCLQNNLQAMSLGGPGAL